MTVRQVFYYFNECYLFGEYIILSFKEKKCHVERTVSFMACVACSTPMTSEEELSRVTVPCSYKGNRYDDLGHHGENHSYRLYCKCGSTYTIVVPCIVVNGIHTLPF